MNRDISIEIANRIRIAVAAYAYEVDADPIMDDAQFDKLALKIRPEMSTSYEGRDNSVIDAFFREDFSPHTGQWVLRHPDIPGLKRYLERARTALAFRKEIVKDYASDS